MSFTNKLKLISNHFRIHHQEHRVTPRNCPSASRHCVWTKLRHMQHCRSIARQCERGFIINKKLVDIVSSFITVLSQVHHKVCLSAYVCVCTCVCVLSVACRPIFNTTHTDPDPVSNLLMLLSVKFLFHMHSEGEKKMEMMKHTTLDR